MTLWPDGFHGPQHEQQEQQQQFGVQSLQLPDPSIQTFHEQTIQDVSVGEADKKKEKKSVLALIPDKKIQVGNQNN